LRARKRSLYEGGIRTFGMVRWPGHVAAGRRDETSVLGGVDWLPTICKLAGVKVPAGVQPDGEDVSDIWFGQSRRATDLCTGMALPCPRHELHPAMLAIREGDWKLFVNHNGSGAQLYNIPKDLSEEHNVAAEHPDLVKQLTAKALAWQKTLPPSKAREQAAATGQPVDTPRQPAAAKKAKGKNTGAANPTTDRALISRIRTPTTTAK